MAHNLFIYIQESFIWYHGKIDLMKLEVKKKKKEFTYCLVVYFYVLFDNEVIFSRWADLGAKFDLILCP